LEEKCPRLIEYVERSIVLLDVLEIPVLELLTVFVVVVRLVEQFVAPVVALQDAEVLHELEVTHVGHS
jgi:hypothetical protein